MSKKQHPALPVLVSAIAGTLLSLLMGLSAWWVTSRRGLAFPGWELVAFGGAGGMLGNLLCRAFAALFAKRLAASDSSGLALFLLQLAVSLGLSVILGGYLVFVSVKGVVELPQLAISVIGLVIGVFSGGVASALYGLTVSARSDERARRPRDNE